MKKGKRIWRGAISIFLCIILLANTAVIGVLIDAARYRMARAQAQAALDSASTSVLSYYNELLFDLYGLFATDSLDEEKITELLSDYTKKTLGVLSVEDSAITQIYNAIVGTVSKEDTIATLNGYNYDITVTTGSAPLVSLANTEAVEGQIIEHMKYRAPLAMLDTNGFLQKLSGLGDVIELVEAALDKVKTDKNSDKKNLAERAADLIERTNSLKGNLLIFTASPDALNAAGTAKDAMDYIEETDDAMLLWLCDLESLEVPTGETEEEYEAARSEVENELESIRTHCETAIEAMMKKFNAVSTHAESYYNKCTALYKDIESLIQDYESYIAMLNAKIEADSSNDSLKAVYQPEIQLAQSTCGSLLRNMDLILVSKKYLENTVNTCADKMCAEELAEEILNDFMDGWESGEPFSDYYTDMELEIALEASTAARNCKSFLTALTKGLSDLSLFAREIEPDETVTSVTEVSVSNSEEEEEKKNEGLSDLDEDDLKIDYQELTEEDWYSGLSEDVSDNTEEVLAGGLKLLKQILQILESGRDSLYINEYAIAYFPNYVQHYNAKDSDLAQEAGNSYLIDSDRYYASYNATQAELEYIITGNPKTALSVAEVSGRLLAIRLALNTAAIFIDSAKVTQANTLAAAVSGPFAPLVATALLVAWALAESTIDVANLLNGESVAFFKQGSHWTLSAEGLVQSAFESIGKMIGTEVENKIKEKIEEGAAVVEQAANCAIYAAYEKLSSNTDAAISAAEDTMQEWAGALDEELQGTGLSFTDVVSSAGDKASSTVKSVLTDSQEIVLAEVSRTVRTISKEVQKKCVSMADDLLEKVTDAAGNALSSLLPEGSASDSSLEIFSLDYMDYMRIFLLFVGNSTKVQRIQSLIQANIRKGSSSDSDEFSMAESYVSVSAELEGSINYLMMGTALLPKALQRDGRLSFRVYSYLSY